MLTATLILFALLALGVALLAFGPSSDAGDVGGGSVGAGGAAARGGHIPGTSGSGVFDSGSPFYQGP